ncbi:predicted protein [Plenodomus lingam JN3]|uniref:Predicted protein n=1 Tax=Leptosphaeria maculans (strain JN3 / isolate v23.1.3 / race Av1-4-5-6-7-8) TaxID=985895 RepID=E4ZUH0_LEPMJ|nr:predicted protein [Plenodomus lingam JN3]CBX95049.1 predicted protein [Plenodomus lingam JN3]
MPPLPTHPTCTIQHPTCTSSPSLQPTPTRKITHFAGSSSACIPFFLGSRLLFAVCCTYKR